MVSQKKSCGIVQVRMLMQLDGVAIFIEVIVGKIAVVRLLVSQLSSDKLSLRLFVQEINNFETPKVGHGAAMAHPDAKFLVKYLLPPL